MLSARILNQYAVGSINHNVPLLALTRDLLVQSLADVKRQLALLESEELAKGIVLNEMSASTYISSVILLEDQQYVISQCLPTSTHAQL